MPRYIHPLQQAVTQQAPVKKPNQNATQSFKDVLQEAITQDEGIKVSKHAKERLSERNIQIHDSEWQVIETKMQEAKNKGVTDALVMTDEAALVVSTENNTVVTALHQDEMTGKIFTNINGTIFL